MLQQVEDFQDGTVSANDCFRPVSRYFDRIAHPAQLLTALPRAIARADRSRACGPVTLALPQDVQAMAYDFPDGVLRAGADRDSMRPPPIEAELDAAASALRDAAATADRRGRRRAVRARDATRCVAFAETHGVPVAETQAGKGALRVGPSAAAGLDRRHRVAGGQRARDATPMSCSRVGTRLAGFHHRLAFDVRAARGS